MGHLVEYPINSALIAAYDHLKKHWDGIPREKLEVLHKDRRNDLAHMIDEKYLSPWRTGLIPGPRALHLLPDREEVMAAIEQIASSMKSQYEKDVLDDKRDYRYFIESIGERCGLPLERSRLAYLLGLIHTTGWYDSLGEEEGRFYFRAVPGIVDWDPIHQLRKRFGPSDSQSKGTKPAASPYKDPGVKPRPASNKERASDRRISKGAMALFYSYSHTDEPLRDKLETHLALLRREGYIREWHDRRIVAGQEWEYEIQKQLDSAEIILLLISADFIASDFCYSVEMNRALERHDEGSAVVVPVILRPCDWHTAPFSKIQAAPKDGKAVTSWDNLDEAFLDVAQRIRKAVTDLSSRWGASSKSATDTKLAHTSEDPIRAAMHSQFGEDRLLRPEFDPILERLRFLESITGDSDVDYLESQVEDLVDLIRSFDRGGYYGPKIKQLLEKRVEPGITILGDAASEARHFAGMDQRNARYRKQLSEAKEQVWKLIAEFLKYQKW